MITNPAGNSPGTFAYIYLFAVVLLPLTVTLTIMCAKKLGVIDFVHSAYMHMRLRGVKKRNIRGDK